jgi:hypothetical protein
MTDGRDSVSFDDTPQIIFIILFYVGQRANFTIRKCFAQRRKASNWFPLESEHGAIHDLHFHDHCHSARAHIRDVSGANIGEASSGRDGLDAD